MKQLLLISILLPVWAAAQEVKPVLSADYLALIRHDTASPLQKDSTNSMRTAPLRYTDKNQFSGGYFIKNISTGNNEIKLQPLVPKYLLIGGSAAVTIEWQQANRQPATQHEFVQGRSQSGSLKWQGPETGEPFSFGPSIHTLFYDGLPYLYDVNGRLVTNGSSRKATPYSNTVLRHGSFLSTDITLFTRYRKNYNHVYTATFKTGQAAEQTIITTLHNKTHNFSVLGDATIGKLTLSSSYTFRQQRYSHGNRNGFLNRVYQNSLLTPVSFSNRQGTVIGTTQRNFSPSFDNPFFLLDNDAHSLLQQQQTGFLSLEQRFNRVKVKLNQSVEKMRQYNREGYQPGTAFFPSGVYINRTTRDDNYTLTSNISYVPNFTDYHIKAQALLNYVLASNRSGIYYSHTQNRYTYRRTSQDLALSFLPEFSKNDVETGMVLSNKFYISSTSTRQQFFLPAISAYTRFYSPFGIQRISAKMFGSFTRSASELPLSRSFATSNQLLYPIANAGQYLPVTEVNDFSNLLPIRHREFTAGIEIYYPNKLTFSASWFSRLTTDDVFPLINAGQLTLVNMASHRNRGIELELGNNPWIWGSNKFSFSNTIGFLSYRSKVISVKEGYNYAPLAGFADVNKALIVNEPLGTIVGNTWLKDAAGNTLIGPDGFPLVNNALSVIGNANPDFTFKINHRFSYKNKWELNIDWEWKKGGDVWNGTRAMLDFYGRSAGSASQRQITGYVFDGLLANGAHNNIAVDFYDPSLPIQQNRWVRYGPGGVAESYMQKADCIRLHNISIAYKPVMKKIIRQLSFSLHANNIILWSAAKGIDPEQLLNDQPGTSGLQFFNLPSVCSVGFTVSLQF